MTSHHRIGSVAMSFTTESLATTEPRLFRDEPNCGAHLQVGGLTGIEAANGDLEIGASEHAFTFFIDRLI